MESPLMGRGVTIDVTKLKINYAYLISLTLTMGFSSTNFGFALCADG